MRALILSFFFFAACDSELTVSPADRRSQKTSIDVLNKVSAKAGDQINFAGQNLRPDMEISVGGIPATYILNDSLNGSFILPEGSKSESGLIQVSFSVKDKIIVTFPVVDSDLVSSLPTTPVPEDEVCSTYLYRNESGEAVRGKVNCTAVTSCAEDGETDCWATESVPAVPKIDLEAKIAIGIKFGDIRGRACNTTDSIIAAIQGQPTVSSNTNNLNVTVSGEDVTHYKYKIRESTDPLCSAPSGYSDERDVFELIDDDLTTYVDGPLQLCVLAKVTVDGEEKWQTDPTVISWSKDTSPPTALLSNVPLGVNGVKTLNVNVSGSDVTQYRYKIRDTFATACSDSIGYSPPSLRRLRIA